MLNRRRFMLGTTAALAAARSRSAWSLDRKPFTMVVPYPPGGSADIFGRLVSNALSIELGEKVVVENRPGAGGTIGASHVATQPADGRTVLYTLGNLLLNQEFLLKDVRFRPMESLVPVGRTCVLQVVIVTRTNFPANDLRGFISMAKQDPGKHSFAYYGDLGIPSMAIEAGIKILRVPYRGGAPALVDTAAGVTDILASSLAQALPLVQAGKLKVLAISGEERLPAMPNIPTIKEIVPGYRSIDYQAVFAPNGTPRPTVDRLWLAVSRVVESAEFRRAAAERGALVRPLGPDELRSFMEDDYANTRLIVAQAGIQPE